MSGPSVGDPITPKDLATGLVLTNRMVELQIARLHLSLIDLAGSKLTCHQLSEQIDALAKANEQQRRLLDRALAGPREGHEPAAA